MAVAAGAIPAAGIIAGGSLLGGLFSAQAEAEKARRERLRQSEELGFETQSLAIDRLSQGQQQAFQNLVSGFQKVLT